MDSKIYNCECGKPLKITSDLAGRSVKCPNCLASFKAPSFDSEYIQDEQLSADAERLIFEDDEELSIRDRESKVFERLAAQLESIAITVANASKGPKEYKVLTQKDKWFSGKFDPESIERALNAYAQQGWSVKGVTTAAIPGAFGTRDELIIILER